MDFLHSPAEVLAVSSSLLFFLLRSHNALHVVNVEDEEDDFITEINHLRQERQTRSLETTLVTSAALNSFYLNTFFHLLGDDLGYWVKPRSTTWFSRFLLEQYDEDRWLKLFRMTKSSVFLLVEILKPVVVKKNTRYQLAILVVV